MRAVIFDADGVLLDSPDIFLTLELDFYAELGLPYERDYYKRERLHGTGQGSFDAARADHRKKFGHDFPEGTREKLKQQCDTLFETRLKPCPHVEEMLGEMDAPLAVASNSYRQSLHRKLSLCGLTPFFGPHIYCAEDVENPKPAPDMFLHAAQKIDAAPKDCIVIEDAPGGIRAALSAGMTPYGYIGGAHMEGDDAALLIQAGAKDVLTDIRDVLRLCG